MRLTLLLLIVSGCGVPPGEVDVTLASFSMLRIYAREQSFEVILGDGIPLSQVGPCPIVSANLTARLNGVSVPLVTRGGKIGEDPGDDGSDNLCGSPRLQLDMPPPDGPSLLELSDPAVKFGCSLPDLKAARQAMLVPPASGTWEWRAGQAVTVQWSPSGDLGLWNSFSVTVDHLNAAGSIDDLTESHDVTFDGDLMRFTVPSVPPGSYVLDVGAAPAVNCGPQPAIAYITSFLTTFGIGHPVTIVP